MFDIDNLLKLGVFNQLIPIWQVFFFIASLLPFLLWDRVKICLLITYLFTYYLGFMVQWGDYLATNSSMQPFVLYSLSGLFIAVFFVATIFTESPRKARGRRYAEDDDEIELRPRRDPLKSAMNVTQPLDSESR
jgi:Na+-translocating ferredoxin:NAD+ oxidoreductase RnfD subunit